MPTPTTLIEKLEAFKEAFNTFVDTTKSDPTYSSIYEEFLEETLSDVQDSIECYIEELEETANDDENREFEEISEDFGYDGEDEDDDDWFYDLI